MVRNIVFRFVELIHDGGDAVAKPALDGIGSPFDGRLNGPLFLRLESTENVIDGIEGCVVDADPQPGKFGRPQPVLNVRKALVPAGRTLRPGTKLADG